MIISFLIKHIRSIIDALIIAALIIAFAIFDPFKWFNTGINIRNTPVSVQSIKQIGQLITAEYYGETIASLPESYMESIDPLVIDSSVQAVFRDLNRAFPQLRKTDRPGWLTFDAIREKNIENRLEENFPWISRSKIYPLMMDYLCDSIRKRSTRVYDRKMVLWKLFDKQKIVENGFKIDSTLKFKGFANYVINEKKVSFKEQKKNIVYIGRGWVKAGINFGKLQPGDIYYNSDKKTLFVKNCEPEILDCNINPWFVPNKVKGFELIKQKGKFENPFAESVRVKKACIEKLRMQAVNSGIINQARENARESLMNLFSLLMNSKVEQVVFSQNKFEQILAEIKKDQKISNQEAQFINELTAKSLEVLDTAFYSDYRMQLSDLKEFCDGLRSLTYADAPFNVFSLNLAAFLENESIDSVELNRAIVKLYKNPSLNSITQKSAMLRIMANYKLSQTSFIDSCLAQRIIKWPKSKFEHQLSSMTHIYRDSLYNRALHICEDTLQNPDSHYAVWFNSKSEFDSVRISAIQFLKTKCDSIALKKESLTRLEKYFVGETSQLKTVMDILKN